jgi:hypothetical protein
MEALHSLPSYIKKEGLRLDGLPQSLLGGALNALHQLHSVLCASESYKNPLSSVKWAQVSLQIEKY